MSLVALGASPPSPDATAEQVEDLSLSVLDPVEATVLQVEGLLHLLEPAAVPTLRGRDGVDRPVGGVQQLVNVIDVVAQLTHHARVGGSHAGQSRADHRMIGEALLGRGPDGHRGPPGLSHGRTMCDLTIQPPSRPGVITTAARRKRDVHC